MARDFFAMLAQRLRPQLLPEALIEFRLGHQTDAMSVRTTDVCCAWGARTWIGASHSGRTIHVSPRRHGTKSTGNLPSAMVREFVCVGDASLVVQGHHRIDARRTARGNVPGHGGDSEHHEDCECKR